MFGELRETAQSRNPRQWPGIKGKRRYFLALGRVLDLLYTLGHTGSRRTIYFRSNLQVLAPSAYVQLNLGRYGRKHIHGRLGPDTGTMSRPKRTVMSGHEIERNVPTNRLRVMGS